MKRVTFGQVGMLASLIAVMVSIAALAEEPITVKFSKRKLFVGPHESCDVGDINRDGYLDIVYGPYWFAGPDWLPNIYRASHTSADYIRDNSDHLYDVDGDGWLDVIMGAWDENGIIWYRNPGNGPAERGAPWEMHLPWSRIPCRGRWATWRCSHCTILMAMACQKSNQRVTSASARWKSGD